MDEITALWIESLKKNGEGYLQVKGKSMEPTVKVGERLKIISVRTEEVNIGDIVVFSPSPRPLPPSTLPSPLEGEGKRMRGKGEGIEFIIHRIIDKFNFLDKLYFVHRGDKAGAFGMSIFAEDQLVGKVKNHPHLNPPPLRGRGGWGVTLLRKFFIYFFIFKQLIKRGLPRIKVLADYRR